ncbi:MAG TPA: hypothetical protein V6D17_24040 [Candidatus Obscuribacterales bacterium]
MTQAPDENAAMTLLAKLEEVAPDDPQELRHRALYYATVLGVRCVKLVTEYVDYCLSPSETGEKPEFKRSDLSQEVHHEAVKELLGLSIWLTMVDQLGGNVPKWLREFFLECWALADKLYPKPSSREIMQTYNTNLRVKDVCQSISSRLCYKLGLGNTKGDACLILGELLWEAGPVRADLLLFSLSQPLEVLDEDVNSLRTK